MSAAVPIIRAEVPAEHLRTDHIVRDLRRRSVRGGAATLAAERPRSLKIATKPVTAVTIPTSP